MGKNDNIFGIFSESKFVRSIFLRVVLVLFIVSIAIIGIVFYSFTSEISRGIISDKQKQLAAIENTISARLAEITSIAYNISNDPSFYIGAVDGVRYTGYEMSDILSKYLVGNSFVEQIAFYRLSEPEKIYSSEGELSFHEFWQLFLNFEDVTEDEYRSMVSGTIGNTVIPLLSNTDKALFSYVWPLPLFSTEPGAFIIMLLPLSKIQPMFDTLLNQADGEVMVFDEQNEEIYRTGTLGESFRIDPAVFDAGENAYIDIDGEEYLVQKQISDTNGWTYLSLILHRQIISGLAGRLLLFIILLLGLMFIAVIVMLVGIVMQYRPISKLAKEVAEAVPEKDGEAPIRDELELLSNSIATLKDSSDQKQHFESAYHEAAAASQAKSAFLSNMSHDIRTPMNAVMGMTALAYEHADEPAYVRECLSTVQVASQYLLDIINNVLDMSRIESGRVKIAQEVVDLPQIINSTLAILKQGADVRQQTLDVDISIRNPQVIGDSLKLSQIITNIISNSLKFTQDGGRIGLTVRQNENVSPDVGCYVFTFSDNGVGMSAEYVQHVFDAFSRAETSANEKIEGTGLGMAIVKNLVELMDGTVSCESTLGEGTTFEISLPLPFAPAAEDDGQQSEFAGVQIPYLPNGVVDLSGRHVLFAEDNVMNREIACRLIAETQAEVVAAANGQEAVTAFEEHPEGFFDVILMDIKMPLMDGFEATAVIRALPRADAKTVQIYAMTANTFAEDIRQVKEAGMNGHIGKPYMPNTLYEALTKAIFSPQQN